MQSPPQQLLTILEVACRLRHFGFARHIDAQTDGKERAAAIPNEGHRPSCPEPGHTHTHTHTMYTRAAGDLPNRKM